MLDLVGDLNRITKSSLRMHRDPIKYRYLLKEQCLPGVNIALLWMSLTAELVNVAEAR